MYTCKFWIFAALVALASSAPPTDPPGCDPSKKDNVELNKCCDLGESGKKWDRAVGECFSLSKPNENPAKAPHNPEGYECFDDCVIDKLDGFGPGPIRKMDVTKLRKAAAELFQDEWSGPADAAVKKCVPLAIAGKGRCASSADLLWSCTERELFMSCPEKRWTNSTLCTNNVARMKKCPNSPPYYPLIPGHDTK